MIPDAAMCRIAGKRNDNIEGIRVQGERTQPAGSVKWPYVSDGLLVKITAPRDWRIAHPAARAAGGNPAESSNTESTESWRIDNDSQMRQVW